MHHGTENSVFKAFYGTFQLLMCQSLRHVYKNEKRPNSWDKRRLNKNQKINELEDFSSKREIIEVTNNYKRRVC